MALARPRSRLFDIRLLGEPQFYADGELQRIAIPPKALLLLCVLCLKAGQPVDRTKLAYTLWPDDAEDEAKGKLRRHLHLLGRALASPDDQSQITATNTTLSWTPSGTCTVDVVEFDRLSRSGEDLQLAVALYHGDLLPNFYEEWLEAPRRRLREQQLNNLLTLADRAMRAEDPAGALEHARAALRIDPWREDAIRHVVLARTHLGDRSGAMQEYAQFVTRLREEFGAEPLAETKNAFEAAKSAEPVATNLPLETTSFVGRGPQLNALNVLLTGSRMVTVTGPGGVGKSRTVIRCARELLSAYSDGVWLIEAGTHSSEEQLLHAIAQTLRIDDSRQGVTLRTLTQRLRDKQTLLVFDNVESFVDPCAKVCESILTSCPNVRILASSREPLAVTGERIMRLAPFEDDADAIALFYDRAHAADASLEDTPQNRRTVTEICRRVDRLPLATELAAARVSTLSLEEILERLHDRFTVLKRPRAPAVRHHQTLRATIGWSHDLLAPEEKVLFRRVAIFPAAFTLAAAEAICIGEHLTHGNVLDALSRLVDKSLVTVSQNTPTRRYRFLDSIREFALCELYSSADVDALRERYLAYYAALAERSAKELSGAHQHVTLQMLEDEIDNVRAALQLGQLDARYATSSLDIACELQQFWLVRGYFAEGRSWFEHTLRAAENSISLDVRARALSSLAMFACFSDDLAAAERFERESLALRTAAGDALGISESLHVLGGIAFDKGDLQAAQALWQECLLRSQATANAKQIAKTLDNLGFVHSELGDYGKADACLQQSLQAYRDLEDTYGLAWVIGHQARLAERMGKYEEAADLHLESQKLREQVGDQHGIANSLHYLSACYYALGRIDEAREAASRSIRIWHELHYKIWLADAFENMARIESARERFGHAATLLGAAAHLREITSKPLPDYQRDCHDATLTAVIESLGQPQAEEKQRIGGGLSLDEMVRLALGASDGIIG
jgi:predicted ATPase/DNA-binding SARP family transcriptional activator